MHFLYFLADDLRIFFTLFVALIFRVQKEEDVGVLHVKLGRDGLAKENRPSLLFVVNPTENLALMQEENDLHRIDVLILPG